MPPGSIGQGYKIHPSLLRNRAPLALKGSQRAVSDDGRKWWRGTTCLYSAGSFAGNCPFFPPFKLFPKNRCLRDNDLKKGGQGGSRTHGTGEGTLDFESSALNHSATCPIRGDLREWVGPH